MVLATAMVFVLASVLTAVAIAGGVVCWRGMHGHLIDNHPYCRRCRYDLTGHHRRPKRCPECGGFLTGLHLVAIGRRKWEPRRAALGVVLVAASVLSMAGAGGVRTAGAAVVSALSRPSPTASPGSVNAAPVQTNPAAAASARQLPASTESRTLGLAGPGLTFWPAPAETEQADDSLNCRNSATAEPGRRGPCFADAALRLDVLRSFPGRAHQYNRIRIALPGIPRLVGPVDRVRLFHATGRPPVGVGRSRLTNPRRHAQSPAAMADSAIAWSKP